METLVADRWDGPLLSQAFRNNRVPEDFKFERSMNSHKLLLVDKTMTTNEFIVMLHSRFFQDIDIKDIWVYKIMQSKLKIGQA